MKKSFRIKYHLLLFTLIIFGCNQPKTNNQDSPLSEITYKDKQHSDSIAKHKADSIEANKTPLYQVSGKIWFRQMWCGGVQIRPDDDGYKSKPYRNKKIVVINGNINSDTCKRLQQLQTNNKGEFMFEVKPGLYGIIVEDWKQVKFNVPNNAEDGNYTRNCLRKEYKKPDIIVNITDKAVSNLSYTVIVYCSGGNICNPNMGNNRP